ncbi:ATP synthase subunit s, mitochondrial [Hemiscyllium ocellatum]|uniref:ATP synthase subunit s, mitochondrial n=1 Tax=Hemiscyllium ocellatum TaxID=170820 RepID=UPI0029661A89|nr:ATP synthase subunit s, mitochondrial [Hemiscyllium ocellatum]XP_060684442.1 ATP synthase subunit s, mitochondrial [Hemiscyllium ocellatum]XP_060684443.1 ATP synthase subunit s, mitochondrial [Hemiscyllium ocellatum]XP_060684444.1 ATP synthase subunit s, mitochondrial [Hemiscyllium ocellatum]
MLVLKTMTSFMAVQCVRSRVCHRNFWGWLNAVFNKVDYDRIKDVGPDRAASEWLLRCGASVRYKGFDKWQKDYNHLPTGPLEKFKIERIDATESCIMFKGFDYLDYLEHVEEIKFQRCIYIQDECLERLCRIQNLQKSLQWLEIISCGNVTDRGILSLHLLKNLRYLFLSDLPGVEEKEKTLQILIRALPNCEIKVDL